VMQTLGIKRMRKRPHHVVLTDQCGETTGAPLAGEDLTGHGDNLGAQYKSTD
jgi:hypothetical protein